MNENADQVEPPGAPSEPVHPHEDEHRSPCPALNALANEGSLPRNGRVTVDQLVQALHERLGITRSIGTLLAKAAMGRLGKVSQGGERVLDLADLALHGFIEHDASLTRRDAREGDAAALSPPLLEQLLSLGKDGQTLSLEDLATAHELRVKQSSADGHRVSLKAGILGTFEAALLYQVLGGGGDVAISKAREFLGSERVPTGYQPRDIGWATLLLTSAKIALMANSPFSAARRRANELAATPAPAASGCPFPHAARQAG